MTPNSTALAVRRPEPMAVARPAAPQVDFRALWDMAEALVPTGFLPDHIRNAGQACAIILAGQELGMPPMRALRSLQLVKGKVTESADSQLARFKSDGGRAAFTELTDTRAELHLRHPNGDAHVESFTMEDAGRAGLTNPSSRGEPSMFTKYPKAMLRSRVITAGLKSIGWEGGAGVYDPEEAAAFTVSTPAGAGRTEAAGTPSSAVGGTVARADLTLVDAELVPLLGKPESWGKKGGQPLGTLDTKLLKRARDFFAGKLEEKDDPRMEEQVAAIELILSDRESSAVLTGQAAPVDVQPAAPPIATPIATTGTDGYELGTLPFDDERKPAGRNALAEP